MAGVRVRACNASFFVSPFFIEVLPNEHPYKLIGKDNVEQAIEWFFNHQISNKLRFKYFETNTFTISPIGLKIPSYGLYFNQINFENIYNKDVTIIKFQNQKDFHAELIAKSIKQYVNTIEILKLLIKEIQKRECGIAALNVELLFIKVFFKIIILFVMNVPFTLE